MMLATQIISLLLLAFGASSSASSVEFPCRAPHPLVAQTHVAPRSPKIAVIAMVYSDVETPPTKDAFKNWWSGPTEDFIYRVSGGCTTMTHTAFIVNVPASETTCMTQSYM